MSRSAWPVCAVIQHIGMYICIEFEGKSYILFFQIRSEGLNDCIYGTCGVQYFIKVKKHSSKFSKLVETKLRDLLLFLRMKTNDETNALCLQKGVFRNFEGLYLTKSSKGKSLDPQFLVCLIMKLPFWRIICHTLT